MIYKHIRQDGFVDASKLRQRVHQLDARRRGLLDRVLRPGPMVVGSLYQMRRRCGKPGCKCVRGQLHASWYLSRAEGGRTKLTYIGKIVPDHLGRRVRRYQEHQKVLAEIRKIDAEISGHLNRLRDQALEGP
ncbi:MAG: DUF6788 family protein [bacterium]